MEAAQDMALARPAGAIALVAIDIDGTLVTADDEVTEVTKTALRRAGAAGLRLVLATGRRYRTTRRVMDALGLALPAICLGGALTKSADGATIRCTAFAPADVRRLLSLARGRGIALALQRDAHALGGPDFVMDARAQWNEPTRRYAEAAAEVCRADPAPERVACDNVLVAGCFGDFEPLALLRGDLHAQLADATTSVLVRSQKTPGWYLEITARRVDKWMALRRFAADAGVAANAICAVGDARNDLPMIRGAGFGVAMGNADPAVKAAADWVTKSNHEDGVAVLLDRVLAQRQGRVASMTPTLAGGSVHRSARSVREANRE